MGLFSRKEKKEEIKMPFTVTPRVSEISESSDLPELPSLDEDPYRDEEIPQLPSFPVNSLGTKFSQNTIKEAISGEKEVAGVFNADDSSNEESPEIMQKPLKKPMREDVENYNEGPEIRTKSIKRNIQEEPENYEEEFPTITRPRESSRGFRERNYPPKKEEPVFVRLDKFEEGMNLFDDIKAQITDMEHLIRNTKEIKTKEEEELNSWQNQLQEVKRQIEKVDKDIFSKIE
jgi:hypothetical protein